MSKEWTVVGTNALESWEPENAVSDPKEKARIRWEKRHKAFIWGMDINRMETQKPKKNHKKEDEDDDAGTD